MRRLVGTGLLAGAVVGAITLPTWGGGVTEPPVTDRSMLLRSGEEALKRGDTGQALRAFERAANLAHMAEAEMGIVRAYMQGGAYRRALTFAAHTAGAHRDVPGGAVLYAWLLHAGGQGAFAQRVLDKIEASVPGDALGAQARARLRSPTPVAEGALLDAPWRVAPFDARPPLPATARVTGSGVLIDAGKRALVPLAALDAPRGLWVRDGLGRRSVARIERRAEDVGLALLRLDQPLDGAALLMLAPRDPFPGSPAFAVEYSATSHAGAAWPLLRAGFIGVYDAGPGAVALDIELPAGVRGGPVFDAGGRLVGIAMHGRDARDRLLRVATLREEFGELLGAVTDPASLSRLSVDGIYETAMPLTLQVIAEP